MNEHPLAVLTERDIEWLRTSGRKLRFAAETELITSGKGNENVYIVLDGDVFMRGSPEPLSFRSHSWGNGPCQLILGDMTLVHDSSASATIKSDGDSTIFSMPHSVLLRHVQEDEGFSARIHHMIAYSSALRFRYAMGYPGGTTDSLIQAEHRRVAGRLLSLTGVELRSEGIPGLNEYPLAYLKDQDIDWMLENGEVIEAKDGSTLIQEGKENRNLYIVLTGGMMMPEPLKSNPWGPIAPVHKYAFGEIVGDGTYIHRGPAIATVKAGANSTVLEILHTQISEHCSEDEGFSARLYRMIALMNVLRLRSMMGHAGGLSDENSKQAHLKAVRYLTAARSAVTVERENWAMILLKRVWLIIKKLFGG